MWVRAPDRPAADAAPRDGPWDATVAHWEGAQICAAELSRMSLHDFAATALDGPNLVTRDGIGGLVTRLAAGPVEEWGRLYSCRFPRNRPAEGIRT